MCSSETERQRRTCGYRDVYVSYILYCAVFKGGVLLAADYSQLELRIIAYLSKDEKLIKVLNSDGDVFKLITAQWKNIRPEEVTAEQRAQAKQVLTSQHLLFFLHVYLFIGCVSGSPWLVGVLVGLPQKVIRANYFHSFLTHYILQRDFGALGQY